MALASHNIWQYKQYYQLHDRPLHLPAAVSCGLGLGRAAAKGRSSVFARLEQPAQQQVDKDMRPSPGWYPSPNIALPVNDIVAIKFVMMVVRCGLLVHCEMLPAGQRMRHSPGRTMTALTVHQPIHHHCIRLCIRPHTG